MSMATEQDRKTLGNALFQAAALMGLSETQASKIIGQNVSEVALDGIDPGSKSGELALLLLRAYQALSTLVAGDEKNMHHWVFTDNEHFDGPPMEAMESCQGLVEVVSYLEALSQRLIREL